MVIVVALVLSLAHEALKDTQQKNVQVDTMQQILRSIKVEATNENAESKFKELISEIYLVDADGNKIPDTSEEAFNLDMKKELKNALEKRRYPVFEAKIDGDTKYIMVLAGKGLWGDIWGYISVNSDGNTVYGADFSHAGETPGLGAEISTYLFSDQFAGKHLFRERTFKAIAIVKSGRSAADRDYVDGISGGTITGNGVQAMIYDSLEGYGNFLVKHQQ